MTTELRERLARRLYETDKAPHDPGWEVLDEGIQEAAYRCVDAFRAELDAAGYAVVRKEPSDAMMLAAIEAFDKEYGNHAWASESSLRVILKAALAATKGEGDG